MRYSSCKALKVLLPVLKDVRAKSTFTPDGRRTRKEKEQAVGSLAVTVAATGEAVDT
ncbi:unnamed protein product, partial [Closterium sp. NIES-54]